MFWSAVLSVCVYFSLVSQQCPEYSTYADCGCMLTCENPYPSDECSENCEPGCYCNPGYFLRSDGQCVLSTQCNNQGDYPPNAQDTSYQCAQDEQYYECPPSCKNTCEHFNNPNIRCKCGPPACFCREGLVKRGDGKCVPPQECEAPPPDPPPDCPPNAIYIPCGSECAPTCEDPRLQSCGDKCVAACFCKPGYLLSKDGKACVLPQHCNLKDIPMPPEPKCPDHAVFIQCGSACVPTCKDMYPEHCGDECVTACFCIPGYLMNINGTRCVRPDQCEITSKPTPTPVDYPTNCPENAVYQDCGTSCPKTCEDSYPSRCSLECVAGCFCKPGYLKRKDGKCVTAQQCDGKNRCGADEQYYECTPSCKNTCKNYNNPGVKCYCGPPSCFCREGLVKREDGKCVRTNQCPNRCGADEQYYECTPSCKNTCKNYNNPGVKCDCGPPGCFCREGLVKREDGKCVRTNQCPITPPQCVENAMFVPCGSSCPPTCDNPNPQPCSQRCIAGCFCKHGFLQTKEGKCVLPEQCKKKNETRCPVYAEYNKCGPACPETCQNTQPRKPCIAACLPGCFCNSGFVKTKDGNCVLPSLCDKKCSLPEEEYLECGSTCPETCDNRGITPPGGCPSKCVRGCFCKKGLLRDLKGACVAPKDCPGQVAYTPTKTVTTSPEYGVTFGETRGCPDRKLCEAFCKSHNLRFGHCVGANRKECHCS